MHIDSSVFLRRVLLADAAATTVSGLLMLLDADLLHRLLGIPVTLLHYSGLSFLPFAAFVFYFAKRAILPAPAVWAVIAYNGVWAAASIEALVSGWIEPAMLGKVFVVAQAVVVGIFAEAEYFGLRRMSRAVSQ